MTFDYERDASHVHCYDQRSPACGQKVEHLYCCLCKKPNERGWKKCQTQPASPYNIESCAPDMNTHAPTPEKQEWEEKWARVFHETYEELAPQFGYETRADTKQFDPTTPNGKLMIAVCSRLLSQTRKDTLEEVKGVVEGMKKDQWFGSLESQEALTATLEALEKKIGAI